MVDHSSCINYFYIVKVKIKYAIKLKAELLRNSILVHNHGSYNQKQIKFKHFSSTIQGLYKNGIE